MPLHRTLEIPVQKLENLETRLLWWTGFNLEFWKHEQYQSVSQET